MNDNFTIEYIKDLFTNFESIAMSMSQNFNMSILDIYKMSVMQYYVSYESFIRLKDAEKEAMEKANKS